MSIENSQALATLQRELYDAKHIAKQREALWERVGTGEVKPINLAVKQRIDRLRTRITASAIRAETHAVSVKTEIDTLFAQVGEKPEQIPLPLYERQLLAHLAIVTDPATTFHDVKDVLNLHTSKTGRKLGWQQVLFSLRKSADNLYDRTHKAHGKFATPDEQEVWNEIRQWVSDKKSAPSRSDFLLHRDYRDNHLKDWLLEKKDVSQDNTVVQEAVSSADTQESNPVTEITLEPGKTYVVKTGFAEK